MSGLCAELRVDADVETARERVDFDLDWGVRARFGVSPEGALSETLYSVGLGVGDPLANLLGYGRDEGVLVPCSVEAVVRVDFVDLRRSTAASVVRG